MVKPTTVEELEQWIVDHENDGMIDGRPIVAEGRSQFRYGYVPSELYDLALTRSAPLGWYKSEIVNFGAVQLLSNAIIDSAKLKLITPLDCENGTEFIGYLPDGVYQLIQDTKNELGWSNSQVMSLILSYFAYNPGIEKIYQQWIEGITERSQMTAVQVEQLIYDRRRLQARKQRLKMSKQQGKLIEDRKVAT